MQDPNEDTEWNDILRAKGIIPEKPKENEIQEEDIIAMMDAAIKQKSGGKSTIFSFSRKKIWKVPTQNYKTFLWKLDFSIFFSIHISRLTLSVNQIS